MRAWYDVRGDAGVRREDEAGVRESQQRVEALIAREQTRGIPAGRIALAGFSQGGAMVLQTGLRHPDRLAGIMALSCFLPLTDKVAAEAVAVNRDVPIFMAHGTQDPLIPLARARHAHDLLTGLGYRIEWHEYPIPHSVSPGEIRDISAWLQRILA
jgi:phospholipase/carboxylesterase